MANLVVAFGIVLAVLGSWAVYFGYNIVQVERGWATMIAGAAVLSGGVVTAALGLVLRRLTAIQAALGRRAVRPRAAQVESKEQPPQLEFALVPPMPPHIDRVVEPALTSPAPQIADLPPMAPVAHVEEAHPTPAKSPAADPAAYDDVDDAWRAVDAELQRTDWSALVHKPDAMPELPLADAVAPHEPAPAAAAEHEFETVAAHVPSPTHVAEPEPIVEAAHPAPPLFASEAVPKPMTLPVTLPATPAHAVAESEFEDDYGDLVGHAKVEPTQDHPPTELAAVATDTAEHPADPAPHVIGKYEADGTTYTMFSDGSIEAHSPEGLYRFGSMAELKAFIEQAS